MLPRAEVLSGRAPDNELPPGGVSSLVSRISFQHRSRYAYTDNNFGWVGASDWLDADLTWNLPGQGHQPVDLWSQPAG